MVDTMSGAAIMSQLSDRHIEDDEYSTNKKTDQPILFVNEIIFSIIPLIIIIYALNR